VAYPTDSGLLARAIRRIAVSGRRIQAAGGATRTMLRDRSRAAGRRAHQIGARLRSRAGAGKDEAAAAVHRLNIELAALAEAAATDAERLLVNAKRALRRARAKAEAMRASGSRDPVAGRRRGRLARAVQELSDLLVTTRQIAAQTRQRMAGVTPDGATRRVSLHDPAVHRIIDRTGRTPRIVTADRGYGDKRVEDDLHDLGVRTVVIPRRGKPTAARRTLEHRPAFRRTIKWRTGSEGRISTLKRQYGWDRTRIDSTEGARTWAGHGVLAHNLVKISALAA
jgi:IS5 family transposase